MISIPPATQFPCDELIQIETRPLIRWLGKIVRVQEEEFKISGIRSVREIVSHPGAVGVIATNGDNEFGLVKQYRHSIRSYLIEPVAGLLDKESESFLDAAKRELREESGLVSENWSHLIDLVVSPGGSTEVIRFFLAEKCYFSKEGRSWSTESEEMDMQFFWLSKEEILDLILTGGIQNSPGIAALMVAFQVLESNERKSPNVDWPTFEHLLATGGIASRALD